MTATRLKLQRIKVNAQGYDSSGAYWGVGPDVFIATSADGTDEIIVRAKNVLQARTKIAAELTRAPLDGRVNEDPIGANPTRKTRHEITWQNPLSGNAIKIRITHSRDYLAPCSDHLEIESIAPKKAALPVTDTGYRSYFLTALELAQAGGPVAFVTAWIDREAQSKQWTRSSQARSQGDLFEWAAASAEAATPRKKAKPSRQGGKPSRRPKLHRKPKAELG
jgi:hypothetical protein